MGIKEATWKAISVLRANGDIEAARILEDALKITGNCQYCGNRLESSFELITLQDTCENCWLVEGFHPAEIKKKLSQALSLLQ